jgi:putative oxidoreductase
MAILSNRAGAPRESGGDAALLILRLVLGLLNLLHGISKLPPPPPGYLVDMLAKTNLPAVAAWAVYIGEVVAPILLIVGVWTRLAAAVVVINMIVAVLLAHTGDLFKIADTGGYALELQAMFLFTAIALVLTGAGRFSVGGRYGPFN